MNFGSARRVLLALVVVATAVAVLPVGASPLAPRPALAATGTGSPATMSDYWDGRAEWVYQGKYTDSQSGQDQVYAGAHVTVVNGIWYLFNRVNYTSLPNCVFNGPGTINGKPIGIQVRQSTDQGSTWSAPTNIITPTSGTQWSCYATDGDAYYNASTSTWTYLFQCLPNLTNPGPWQGCVVTKSGASPMGLFSTPAGVTNPVVPSGSIWTQICKSTRPTSICVAKAHGQVGQEGTFQIIKFDGTYYWIGFHGVDGSSPIKGFRGVAKTTDFKTYISGNTDGLGDTPIDTTLSDQDAPGTAAQESGVTRAWHEDFIVGAQGAGDAAILQEGGYYYQMVEEPDANFAGVLGQNWDYGIYRAKTLTATSTQWEPLPRGNPVVFSSTTSEPGQGGPLMWGLQYQRMFTDPSTGFTYLTYGRRSTDTNVSALYFFRLEKSTNLLMNADFGRGDAYPWIGNSGTTGTTTMSVRRDPNGALDGGSYLALSCASCSSGYGNGVYQDVNVAAYQGQRRTFVARLPISTTSGQGAGTFNVYQFDATGAQIGLNSSAFTATTTQQTYALTAVLNPSAATVRYSVSLDPASTATYRIANTALTLNGGVTTNWPGADPGNVARYAYVSASSTFSSQFAPANARDGLFGAPNTNEWASLAQSNPWIQYNWNSPQLVSSMTVMDRPGADDANGGLITFSNGYSVNVSSIPPGGAPLRVEFPAQAVTSMRFQVVGGVGPDVGLAELEVHGAPFSTGGDGDLAKTVSSVTASSQYSSAFAPANVTDGQAYVPNKGEWASLGQQNPWVQLNWSTGIKVNEVRLFDRAGNDDARAGTLYFSDGSTLAVTGLDPAGQPSDVTFPTKTGITWIKFQVTNGTGPNVGLAEFSVWDGRETS